MLPAYYKESKKVLLDDLNKVNHVALTTDLWTSVSNDSYVTVHYVEWVTMVLKCAVLATRQVHGKHTGENIAGAINAILLEFGLQEKVVCVVTDNAANMKTAVENIYGSPRHLPCIAHTMNLCVNDAINDKQCESLKELISRCKGIVTFFRRSPSAMDKLKKVLKERREKPLKLIQDVPTRWNSELFMIERLLKIEDSVTISLVYFTTSPNPLFNTDYYRRNGAVSETFLRGY